MNIHRGTNEPLHALLQPPLHTAPYYPPADTLQLAQSRSSPFPIPHSPLSHSHLWAESGLFACLEYHPPYGLLILKLPVL